MKHHCSCYITPGAMNHEKNNVEENFSVICCKFPSWRDDNRVFPPKRISGRICHIVPDLANKKLNYRNLKT